MPNKDTTDYLRYIPIADKMRAAGISSISRDEEKLSFVQDLSEGEKAQNPYASYRTTELTVDPQTGSVQVKSTLISSVNYGHGGVTATHGSLTFEIREDGSMMPPSQQDGYLDPIAITQGAKQAIGFFREAKKLPHSAQGAFMSMGIPLDIDLPEGSFLHLPIPRIEDWVSRGIVASAGRTLRRQVSPRATLHGIQQVLDKVPTSIAA